MIFYLVMALFFICMQGFFAGMETGMVSVMRRGLNMPPRQGGNPQKSWCFSSRIRES